MADLFSDLPLSEPGIVDKWKRDGTEESNKFTDERDSKVIDAEAVALHLEVTKKKGTK
jgi:hypothetical protein